MKTLCIAPHADDVEYGMGGYLSRIAREELGEVVVGVIAGGDYLSRWDVLVRGDQREKETAAAMEVLGVKRHCTLAAAPENRFDVVGRRDLVAAVDALLKLDMFDEVFIPLPSFNQDHQALFDACITAFRPGRWPFVKRIWAYEYPGNCMGPQPPAWGRCYVKLEGMHLAMKTRSLLAHESQLDGHGSQEHVGIVGMRALAALRGSECGAQHAELFYLVREVF